MSYYELDVNSCAVSFVVQDSEVLLISDRYEKMQGCKLIPASAAAAASSAPVTSSLTSNHVVAGGRAAQRLQESGSQQQQQLLKVGLPMMASDSAKVFSANSARLQAMNRPCSSTQKKSSRQLVAVRATQIDTFIKGLQEKLHLPTHESETSQYVSVNGTLTVRKKSLLTYMDVGSDLIDDTEDALFDQKVLLQLVSSDVLDPSEYTWSVVFCCRHDRRCYGIC